MVVVVAATVAVVVDCVMPFIEYNLKCDLLLFEMTESEPCTHREESNSSVPDYTICVGACVRARVKYTDMRVHMCLFLSLCPSISISVCGNVCQSPSWQNFYCCCCACVCAYKANKQTTDTAYTQHSIQYTHKITLHLCDYNVICVLIDHYRIDYKCY